METLKNILLNEFNRRAVGVDDLDSLWTAAVLLPLVMKEDGPHILFEVRAKNLKRQPGEICFPGGKYECKDESYEATCVRETCEELGLNPENIEILGEQDSLVTYRGPIIHIFVGIIKHPEKVVPSSSEVDEVFTVPLKFFLDVEPRVGLVNLIDEPEEGYPYELVPDRYVGQRRLGTYKVYFYEYAGRIIWGLTARFIYAFLQRHKQNLQLLKGGIL